MSPPLKRAQLARAVEPFSETARIYDLQACVIATFACFSEEQCQRFLCSHDRSLEIIDERRDYDDGYKRAWGLASLTGSLVFVRSPENPFGSVDDALVHLFSVAEMDTSGYGDDDGERGRDSTPNDTIDKSPVCTWAIYDGDAKDVESAVRLGTKCAAAESHMHEVHEHVLSERQKTFATNKGRLLSCRSCRSLTDVSRIDSNLTSYYYCISTLFCGPSRLHGAVCRVCGTPWKMASDSEFFTAEKAYVEAVAALSESKARIVCIIGGWTNIPDK